MEKDKKNDNIKNIINQSLDIIMSDRYGRYAKYIIQQRALPDARDGLKPVQRRILFSMNDLGLLNNKAFKKSARVVGDVIGKYHPHGDSSIYEAMVRMAQDWKMNSPLIEMHGNKGSIDDDPAAAMRYTEVRLTKIANLMLQDIGKNIVPFAPNFDDSEKEPTVLPAFIPNLLINGAKGIAAGFATEMPPHNLSEVIDAVIATIKNPQISPIEIANFIKGPDFPTGGIIYGTKGIKDALSEGRGKITLSSKWDIEDKQIIINQIPYGVIKSKLVRQIDEIIQNENLDGVKEIRDESSRNGIRIVIDLDKNQNAQNIINYLIKKTELQIYYNYNNIAISNSAPKLMNISNLINAYLMHLKEVQLKTFKFDLDKHKRRLEIVEGFIKLSYISNEVIELIRNSENSKEGVIQNLIKVFQFTYPQAEAIANLRLYKLSKTDTQQYLKEKEELIKEIERIEKIISNATEFNKYLINILNSIKKEYGEPRKTQIIDEELSINISMEQIIANDEIYIAITKKGYFKKFSPKTYSTNDIQTYLIKDDDALIFLSKMYSNDKLLIFTSKGQFLNLVAYKINEEKWKNLGTHINTFSSIDPDEDIIKVLVVKDFNNDNQIVLFSKLGYAKKVELKDFENSRYSKIKQCFKFKKENDSLIDAFLIDPNEEIRILTILSSLKIYNFSLLELRLLNLKNAGLKMIANLEINKNFVTSWTSYKNEDNLIFISERGLAKKLNINQQNNLFNQIEKNNVFLTKQTKTNPNIIKRIFAYDKNNENDTKIIIRSSDNNITILANELSDKEEPIFKNLNIKYVEDSFIINETLEKLNFGNQIENNKSLDNNIEQITKTKINNYIKTKEKSKANIYENQSDDFLDNEFDKMLEKTKEIKTFDIDDILNKIK